MRSLLHWLIGGRAVFLAAWLPAVFVVAALPVTVFLAVAVPAGELPDEVTHIIRADSVRHGEISGFRQPRRDEQGDPAVDVIVRADYSLLDAGFVFIPGAPLATKQVTRARLDRLLGLPWMNRLVPVSIPNTAVYPPLLYMPAAAGMQLAKVLGYGPYIAILAARVVNAIVYVTLGAMAIGLASRGRAVLITVLCLPMSLALAASVNHDGLIIACAGLAGALLTRPGRAEWWWGAVLFSLAAMAKPYLLPLALIVPVTVPGGLRPQARRAIAGLAVAAGPALAWALAMAVFVAAPFVRGPARPAGPLWAGLPGTMFPTTNPGEQLRILLASPGRLIGLPLSSAWEKGEWLWREGVGVLGTLDVTLPERLYSAWGWVVLLAALAGMVAARRQQTGLPLSAVAAAILGAVCSVWLAYLLQYLSWTRVGEASIEGIQGRYFIPVAAVALPVAMLPWLRVPAADLVQAVLALPVALLALAGLVFMPLIILGSYYVR